MKFAKCQVFQGQLSIWTHLNLGWNRVEFFWQFPDLIMDRVWEWLEAQAYNEGDILIKQGEISDYMFIVYRGDVGVYINVEYNNRNQYEALKKALKPVVVKTKRDIFGEQGLLKASKRGASCIAMSQVLAFKLSAENYAHIIESFHKSELFRNIKFLSELDFIKFFVYGKIELLAKWFNSKLLK